ncbi:hypothetical protein SYNTR_0011 [Candidatus Syntrophocurvum alkaliphilum]|uniref:DUF3267 domain-containing protein n=1 Tax=Candidatus Syntrophocurvum alkaliphilum TaxID=2293317 RepID=A0A6I6DAQ1_9FIRM|nr:DUF3267 domain-containing protein [Candidatus Syntrophocurvum alkaliphilum]QGT98604.1 hypothetical protein SYNTR_0011 [Candidatus Syntrophocurvum alkaliphilum]
MKYAKNIPPTDKNLSKQLIKEGWTKIKEPSNFIVATLLSIPFMLLTGLISFYIISFFNPPFADAIRTTFYTGSFSVTIKLEYILFIYLTVLLHELLHAVFIPNFMQSEKTYFGIRPWGGFVYTTEKLEKNRFLLISLAPFLILSVILPIVLGLLDLLNGLLAFLILLNAIASSVDFLNAVLIIFQVPKGATIVNNGFETYYKNI